MRSVVAPTVTVKSDFGWFHVDEPVLHVVVSPEVQRGHVTAVYLNAKNEAKKQHVKVSVIAMVQIEVSGITKADLPKAGLHLDELGRLALTHDAAEVFPARRR